MADGTSTWWTKTTRAFWKAVQWSVSGGTYGTVALGGSAVAIDQFHPADIMGNIELRHLWFLFVPYAVPFIGEFLRELSGGFLGDSNAE